MGQKFSCGIADCLIAEVGGVTMRQLHTDAAEIARAYDAVRPLAERLGLEAPRARLAGFAYPHVAALGAEIVFPEDSEPRPLPLLRTADDIDRLEEPGDYLAAPLVRQRLETARELRRLRPDASLAIGHIYGGPVTTAVLLLGEKFFLLPYDDPARAHRLLRFCADSAVGYARALRRYLGVTAEGGAVSIPDDFAGIFPPRPFSEFVVRYWNRMYEGMGASSRHLHSELLRTEHLPFLKDAGLSSYDPSADRHLTVEVLSRKCPCLFAAAIQSWEIQDLPVERLKEIYRERAGFHPSVIHFAMERMEDEPKILGILETARRLQQENPRLPEER